MTMMTTANDDERLRDAMERARVARGRAHAPYSHFHVGAALVLSDGDVIEGCNVENASYGLTMCAERVALGRAVAQGHRSFFAIAVCGPDDASCAPCGACRQALAEFAPGMTVAYSTPLGPVVTTLDALLPRAFDATSLP